MISSAWKFGKDIPEIKEIRSSCGLPLRQTDEKSMHLLLFDDGVPVGCGSLYFDKEYHIGDVCVLEEKRREHIGDLLMRMLLMKGFNMLAEKIIVVATEDTLTFFEKYGFKKIENFILEVTPHTLKAESKCGHNCKECLNPCT